MKKYALFLFLLSVIFPAYTTSAESNCELTSKFTTEGDALVLNGEYLKAIDSYRNATLFFCDQSGVNFTLYFNMGETYGKLNKNKEAFDSFSKAFDNAYAPSDIEKARAQMAYYGPLAKDDALKGLSASEDPYSYKQYYLRSLSVVTAWTKVPVAKQVTVAVIDDGALKRNPDLKNRIKGGVMDFVGTVESRSGEEIPSGVVEGLHGTMVAGIIGAETNNQKGIAGIAKNVRIIPLRVSGSGEVATEAKVSAAIDYAVFTGANIINLSLGNSAMQGGTQLDQSIRKAYEKGVIVVADVGDAGDLSLSGSDTASMPTSLACNNGGLSKYSLGTAAMRQDGSPAPWSNHGKCATFWLPAENIVTLAEQGNAQGYAVMSGASFTAPMLSGIIALGYNKYGYVPFEIVKEELAKSISDFSWEAVTGTQKSVKMINADRYIESLGLRIKQIRIAQAKMKGKRVVARSSSLQASTSTANPNLPLLNAASETGTDLSSWEYLANEGIIQKQETVGLYRLQDQVLRQEVVAMAIKLSGTNLANERRCQGYFKDVTAIAPNGWVCRIVEIAADLGIISKGNDVFRPEETITRAEALAMLLKGANVEIPKTKSTGFKDVKVDWQVDVVNAGLRKGISEGSDRFYPDRRATRAEIFDMARRIHIMR